MNLEILTMAVSDLAMEQKNGNKLSEELIAKVDELGQQADHFQQKLDQLRIIAPPPDTAPFQEIIREAVGEIRQAVDAQPKNIIRQFRLVLFPETNMDHYYRIVFGRLFPWTGVIIVAILLISLGKKYVESSTLVNERRYYYEVYQDAWNRLDTALGKPGQLKMKHIMQQAVNAHQ